MGLVVDREAERRARTLERLHLLDVLPPESLERIARLAGHIAGGAGISVAVHLLDEKFQHRVASVNAPRERYPVEESLCRHVVEDERSLYLPDPPADPRFEGNPWTSGPDPLRMYYGVPLRLSDSGTVGSLCVFSTTPVPLDAEQRARLADLADQASAQLDLIALTRELGHDAAHDALTGLPNRVLLSHRLTAALSRRGPRPVLLLLDLDGFKQVNDSHGHVVGDEVLVSTAERLRAAVRPSDVVARLGGDEFAVLVEDVPDDDVVRELVGRLRDLARRPHVTSVGEVLCGFSLGRARARDDELPYELLGRADADLYVGKRLPRQG